MSYDGAGSYTPPSPEYPAVAGQLIKSSDFNVIIEDSATALSSVLVRDGRAPMTGALAMGANTITGLANGAAPQDATTVLQVFTAPTISDPTFTGVPVAPTAAPGTNTTQIATMAAIQVAAFSAVLPTQAGNAGKFVQTDGTAASWVAVPPPSVVRVPRTADTILGVADSSKLFDVTSGTFTQTFTAAATLGDGWFCYIRNSGTGDITLDPNGAELIDGLASYVMYPGETRLVQCDGSAFTSVVMSSFAKDFLTSGTFIMPPGYKWLGVKIFGGGSSGQGGVGGANGTDRRGGAAGGGGGQNIAQVKNITGDSVTVTVGAGGASPAGGTGGSYRPANAGGVSSFGSEPAASGGMNDGRGGSAGASRLAVGWTVGGSTLNPGNAAVSAQATGFFGGHNTDSTSPNAVGCSEYGGSGGGIATLTPISGAKSLFGATGGGAGGYVNTSNAVSYNGAGGGGVGWATVGGGAAGGAGSVGTAGAVLATGAGGGGGGGDGRGNGAGYAGGEGAQPGGGGGGGGAGLTTGGAGGKGGDGAVYVWGVM